MKGTSWSIMNDGSKVMLELGLTSVAHSVGTQCASVEFPTVLSLLRGVENGAIPLDGTLLQLTRSVKDASELLRDKVLAFLRCAVYVSHDSGTSGQLPSKSVMMQNGLKKSEVRSAMSALQDKRLIAKGKVSHCCSVEYPTVASLLQGVEKRRISFE